MNAAKEYGQDRLERRFKTHPSDDCLHGKEMCRELLRKDAVRLPIGGKYKTEPAGGAGFAAPLLSGRSTGVIIVPE